MHLIKPWSVNSPRLGISDSGLHIKCGKILTCGGRICVAQSKKLFENKLTFSHDSLFLLPSLIHLAFSLLPLQMQKVEPGRRGPTLLSEKNRGSPGALQPGGQHTASPEILEASDTASAASQRADSSGG